ncbi:sigma-70 family RNA polymerase sigma factor [Kaistella palustris]|uniref:sigma-70 family RNA polymerase sigma factor n=1 Tax=Kaistella palustris TaxID=493376 RepID=UPI00041703E9|nr:sigma-70 family RNA polymerase sigma factor [Kaistella palustris]
MDTQTVWNNFNSELYFFILKKVKDKNAANDILQNSFLKIHHHISTLRNPEKIRAWVYQIVRNEIIDYLRRESAYSGEFNENKEALVENYDHACCFDQFLKDLPEKYRTVIDLLYVEGKKQQEVANLTGLSLENVKIRVKRAKNMLKKNFTECCKYQLDEKGNLTGEPNCAVCTGL